MDVIPLPYLSHEALGIELWEHEGLSEFVQLARLGRCKVDMTRPELRECDTAACIGGWVAALKVTEAPKDYVGRYRNGKPLSDLYYPILVEDWSAITTEIAADVVEHFLRTDKIDYRRFIALRAA